MSDFSPSIPFQRCKVESEVQDQTYGESSLRSFARHNPNGSIINKVAFSQMHEE